MLWSQKYQTSNLCRSTLLIFEADLSQWKPHISAGDEDPNAEDHEPDPVINIDFR